MTKLEIGYLLPSRDQAVGGEHESSRLVGQARRAEASGFDSVWAGDSPVSRPRADSLLLLAAVAQATERVTLGTAVMLPALRHPILLAHQLATLDRLSDGRLIVGMGGGFPSAETRAQFAAIGIAFTGRGSRMEESIHAMRRLWSGDAVSHHGRHFAFDDVRLVPRPSRPGGPPIWLAGSGGPALGRVARLADGWLPYPPTATRYAQEYDVIREGGTATPGRAVTPALYATLCLDDDPQRARQRLRDSIESYYNAPLPLVASIQAMFAGTADEAADWLHGYVGAGARHLVIRLATDDHESDLEEFAARVLPLLRKERSR
ncbi:LLM class flavin-dependent oxidoreductase [Actinoplanes utahensis]|uniref:5,10-methylene tetrahydromethanopterin reductase n=1 Tax=Actinoplanes utahensis TaxID=1869 RepID=A0A0A6XB77_ACTUT|nr:LLM class flavin-dependent oxidoreductase [Actinoplanes utahensis]KHD77317.1 5,10-methylene tetrahydromethanopterin reductase [Actinoplanes utahensis]GIF32960.1 N5,N10-methylene tetrahydromethanopterin reductase [Actinoplanes utahensis]